MGSVNAKDVFPCTGKVDLTVKATLCTELEWSHGGSLANDPRDFSPFGCQPLVFAPHTSTCLSQHVHLYYYGSAALSAPECLTSSTKRAVNGTSGVPDPASRATRSGVAVPA